MLGFGSSTCDVPGCGGPRGMYGVCDEHRDKHPAARIIAARNRYRSNNRPDLASKLKVCTCSACRGNRRSKRGRCQTCRGYGKVLIRQR